MSQVQEIKALVDIVGLIGEKVPLQRSGVYFKGLCPFHSEKTPSFFVSETMQRFQCFGCGAGGDVFEFLMRYEGMSFYEALESLADRAGVELRQEFKTQDDEEREKILAVLELANNYYHFLLTKHRLGQKAREYLQNRKVTADSIKLFSLGYALKSWDGLISYLNRKKKYPIELLVKAGLVIAKSQTRHYDRFRDRIIFPLRNHRGQVVGFSGRSLDPLAKEAKYINSPETVLYHKSKMLYGFSELRRYLLEAKTVVVTEGEFDVISSAQANVNQVVAIKGSAFTPDHARLISRVAQTVILALDADQAGLQATRRALNVLKPFELELKVITVAEGKDPDEWARSDPKGWREALKKASTAYDFLIQLAVSTHGVETANSKKQVIKELASDLWQIESGVEREVYIKKLAQALQTQAAVVQADIKYFSQKTASSLSDKKDQDRQDEKARSSVLPLAQTRLERLERYLLFLLLHSKQNQLLDRFNALAQFHFSLPAFSSLITQYRSRASSAASSLTVKNLSVSLPADLQQELMTVFADREFGLGLQALDLQTGKPDKEWELTLSKFQEEQKLQARQVLAQKIAQLETKPELNPQETDELKAYLNELTQQK